MLKLISNNYVIFYSYQIKVLKKYPFGTFNLVWIFSIITSYSTRKKCFRVSLRISYLF